MTGSLTGTLNTAQTLTMTGRTSISRSIGQFFGHIVRAVRTDPSRRMTARRSVEEREDGDVVLRRTTIDEIEFRKGEGREARGGEEARRHAGTED